MSLEYAIAHKDALRTVRLKVLDDPHFFWYAQGVYVSLEQELATDTWASLQKVSLRDGEIIGYLAASISRSEAAVTQIEAVNFTKEISVTFSKDFRDFILSLFDFYQFHKGSWSMVVGNPAEAMYDRIIEQYGGRAAGYYREDVMMRDGMRYDKKWYEMLRADYCRAKVSTNGKVEVAVGRN